MNKDKIREFFNEWALSWDANMVRNEEIISTILDNAKVEKGKDILDVACGTGVLIEDYLKRNVSSVTGIDISEKMIEIASSKYPNVEFICGDAENYTTDKRFDCIIIYNAFPHFTDPDQLFANLKTLLKEDGILSIAHSASRERINAHHDNVSEVSKPLPPIEELKAVLDKYLTVTLTISDERMYQITAQKNN